MRGIILSHILIISLCFSTKVLCTIDGCYNYGSPVNNKETCNKCYPGKTPSASKEVCVSCPNGCIECDVNLKCISCSSNLYLVPETGECKSCGGNCKTCSASSCSECLQEYYVDSKDKKCIRCPENCMVCSDYNTCTSCKPGFEVTDKKGTKGCKKTLSTAFVVGIIISIFICACCVLICCCVVLAENGQSNSSRNYQPIENNRQLDKYNNQGYNNNSGNARFNPGQTNNYQPQSGQVNYNPGPNNYGPRQTPAPLQNNQAATANVNLPPGFTNLENPGAIGTRGQLERM